MQCLVKYLLTAKFSLGQKRFKQGSIGSARIIRLPRSPRELHPRAWCARQSEDPILVLLIAVLISADEGVAYVRRYGCAGHFCKLVMLLGGKTKQAPHVPLTQMSLRCVTKASLFDTQRGFVDGDFSMDIQINNCKSMDFSHAPVC